MDGSSQLFFVLFCFFLTAAWLRGSCVVPPVSSKISPKAKIIIKSSLRLFTCNLSWLVKFSQITSSESHTENNIDHYISESSASPGPTQTMCKSRANCKEATYPSYLILTLEHSASASAVYFTPIQSSLFPFLLFLRVLSARVIPLSTIYIHPPKINGMNFRKSCWIYYSKN